MAKTDFISVGDSTAKVVNSEQITTFGPDNTSTAGW